MLEDWQEEDEVEWQVHLERLFGYEPAENSGAHAQNDGLSVSGRLKEQGIDQDEVATERERAPRDLRRASNMPGASRGIPVGGSR